MKNPGRGPTFGGMKTALLLSLSLIGCTSASALQKLDATPQPSVEALQLNWDTTKSFQADFVQTVKSKGLGMDEEPSSGTVSVVKPGRLRWEDKTNHVTQILNEGKYWEIAENKRRKSRTVTHTPDVSGELSNTAFQVLAGTGKFVEFFRVKLIKETPKEAVLELIPKTKTNETLIAKIDKKGYVLRSLTTNSQDSQVVVTFSNIRRNTDLGDSLFSYEKQENDVFQTRK